LRLSYTQSLETEAARLEAKVEEQKNELMERGLLISQLERLGSSLREEAIELRSDSSSNLPWNSCKEWSGSEIINCGSGSSN